MSKEKPKTTATTAKSHFSQLGEKATFAFEKENYKLLIIGAVLVAIGMVLMISKPSTNPNKMADTLFDFQRIVLSPIVIIAGYVVVLLSILKKPKE